MKLIKDKEGYYLCIEENVFNSREFIATTDGMYVKHKLSKQNCDEIFGVIDVDNLVDKFVEGLDISEKVKHDIQFGYQEGLIKSMELNKDKLFTVEDVKKAIYIAWEDDNLSSTDIIQLLQQPTEIEVEIEMTEDYLTWKKSDIEKMSDCLVPKLDKDGCLILIKKK